jgi:hypothetical protein
MELLTLEEKTYSLLCMHRDLLMLRQDFGKWKLQGAFSQELPQKYLDKKLYQSISSQGLWVIEDWLKLPTKFYPKLRSGFYTLMQMV